MSEKFDVFVIGAGPGGYAAAIRCAQRGASVAIAEKEFYGGTCLNCGCVPSKALLASAHVLHLAKHAAAMGVDIPQVSPNWQKMLARKDMIVTGFRKGVQGLLAANRVKMFNGTATVTSPNKIEIKSQDTSTIVEANNIILANGSESIQIPAFAFDGKTIISSKEALSLTEIPKSMVIIGGGVIGCELACVYACVGTKVTIVEALTRLVPMEDTWVGQMLEREFKKLGIDILVGKKVTGVDVEGQSAKVKLESGEVIDAEKVLVSVGRKASCDKQTVDALKLEMNGSRVKANSKMETNAKGVYAIGDVVGMTYLAHGAFAEAEVAAINATGGSEEIKDYSSIPRAVYTFPEVASVGKSEEKCKAEGMDVTIGRAFFKANGRSLAHNETVGEIRTVRDKKSDRIIGITMVGPMVTELAAAARMLIGTAEKIDHITFAHPTISEVLKEAAEDAYGISLHNPPKQN